MVMEVMKLELQTSRPPMLDVSTLTPRCWMLEPANDGFPIGISFSKGPPFSGSMFVLGGVSFWFIVPSFCVQIGKLKAEVADI